MLTIFRAKRSNVLVWILMGLLIVGLAGFGITTGGGGGQAVARVGDQKVEADEVMRALDQELRAIGTQIGRALPMSEARQFGIDRMVLARLVGDAALDDAAAGLGLSSGDASVQRQILATPAFQGLAGGFDREAYRFAIDRIGLSETEFEALLRAEVTRELIATSLQSAVTMPASASRILLEHIGEQRRFDWVRLDAGLLDEPVPEPGDGALLAFHDANAVRYTRPETRQITYAALTPEMLAESIEVPEDELRAAYDAAGERYQRPERRIVDRIGFPDDAAAAAARARIDAGEIDFDALAAERGLGADEIDQGDLAAGDLAAEAAEAVFGLAEPGIAGPVPTPLGPSLFRVNAILAPSTTPFETARDELRRERALERASTQVLDVAPTVEDLIAGGATIEEIAAETPLEIGALALDAGTTGGLADDPAFRELAEAASTGAETDLASIEMGGIVTLRVDAVLPPALIPLPEIRAQVAADWRADETASRLVALAERFATELREGVTLAEIAERIDRPVTGTGPIARGAALPDLPPGFVADLFEAAEGDTITLPDGDGAILAQLVEILPFDAASPENAALSDAVQQQMRTQAADDALALYIQAQQQEAGVSINQPLFEQLLARFP
jgi:peptidyl-prolyl cis-trans isomerase D